MSEFLCKNQDKTIKDAIEILQVRLDAKRCEPLLNSYSTLKDFLVLKFSELSTEHFAIIYQDADLRYIKQETLFMGSSNCCSVYPKEIVKNALLNNASAIVIVHNHPGGRTMPSDSDISLTKEISSILKIVDISVTDHIVVSGSSTFSFHEQGIL